jgi:hypothetical protein
MRFISDGSVSFCYCCVESKNAESDARSLTAVKTLLNKIGEYVAICFGVLFGIVIFGFIAGAVTILVLRGLIPSLPWESVTPPADNIADRRSLAVIAIGCLAILCFFFIRRLVSRPLGKLIEKGFAKWDAAVARGGSVVEWMGQFILSKPAPEQIQAAQEWAAKNSEFDTRVFSGDYRDHSGKFEAEEHALTMQKKALSSYPRVKKAGKIRGYLVAVPICLFLSYGLLFVAHNEDETADNQEAVDQSASHQWSENPELRRWWLNLTLVCSAIGFPLWLISSLSAKRYQKMLGADVGYVESDNEIYVANPTDFESWRQAFIDHHGHDMSAEQEKKLRATVDKVIDADQHVRAASKKLSEKIDE